MTFRRSAFFAVLGLVLFTSFGAKAASIFSNNDLGTLSIGDSGPLNTVNVGKKSSVVHHMAEGYIPANSFITFSFTFSGVADKGPYLLSGHGAYDYDMGDSFAGTVYTNSNGGNDWKAFVNGLTSSEQLVFATSNLANDFSGGSITFTNLSKGLMWFSTTFLGKIANGFSSANWSVAAVPLPAALPLFGIGLLGLVGARRLRQNRKAA